MAPGGTSADGSARLATASRRITAATALLILAVTVVGAVLAYVSRDHLLREAESDLGKSAFVLAEETARTLETIALVQNAVVERVRDSGIVDPAIFADIAGREETHRLLASRLSAHGSASLFAIAGPDGRLLASSRIFPAPDTNVADRDFFQALTRAGSDATFVGAPVVNRGTGKLAIHVARKIDTRGGTMLGFIVGTLDLDKLESFYAQILPSRDGAITLRRSDGQLLARHAAPAVPGDRLKVTRAVDGYPLTVTVSDSVRSITATWSEAALVIAVLVALADFIILYAGWLFHREVNARAAANRAAAVAAENEERYRLLADNCGDVILLTRFDGSVTYVSPSVRGMLGYEVDQARAMRMSAVVHPDDLPRVRLLGHGLTAEEPVATIDYRLRHADGHYICALASIRRLEDKDGSISFISTIRDITARREAEMALAEKSETLTVTLDTMDQGLMMVDAERRVRVCNRRACELLDLPPDFMAKQPLFADVVALQASRDDFSEVDRPFLARAVDDLFAPAQTSYERVRPNGLILEISTMPVAGGGVVRTYRDISERRKGEEARRAAETEYRDLFQNAVAGIYRSTIDGRMLRANPALVQLNGYDTEEELIAAVRDIDAEWYVERGRREEFVRLMLENGRVTDFVSEIYRHRTRERIWVSETAWIVRDATGEPIAFEGTVVDATDRKMDADRATAMALHDVLTGLPNRRLFSERLAQAIAEETAQGHSFAVLSLDLDRFKIVNDTLGHAAGDALLKCIGERLRSVVRAGDMVARFGGDEFAVLLPRIADEEPIHDIARRIIAAVDAPVRIEGHQVGVGVSIGAAWSRDVGAHADDLLAAADLALYRAKNAGRNTHILFETTMAEGLKRRRNLELDLQYALARGELALDFQPIQSLPSRAVLGYEALLRWNHPTLGLVPPGEFIPLAEEARLIGPIGDWCLREACRQAASWPGDTRVSVNISPVQFRAQLVDTVVSALARSGLAAHRLELEITETVLMRDEKIAVEALQRLRGLGVKVALDDFGTGYSSLSYLRLFAFDKIKIDRAFIQNVEDPATAAIVRAVVELAASLGASTTAEGIETESQCAHAAALGCQEGQGYLLGRPIPAVDVPARLAETRSRARAAA